jgi:hypothetical protein
MPNASLRVEYCKDREPTDGTPAEQLGAKHCGSNCCACILTTRRYTNRHRLSPLDRR